MHNIILGFDFGLKRIGVAIGQTTTRSANPLTILKANRGVPDWSEVKKLIATWGVDTLIVGLPLNMDGAEQPITQQARKFAEQLNNRFQLPIIFVDERLTTVAARDEIHSTLKGAKRFERADSVSAKLIIESWLAAISDR